MLQARNLSKRFHGLVAVDDVSFIIRPGEVAGYLGPNGSGKSTTMKMLVGLLEPTDGNVLYDGIPIRRDLTAYRRILGYVPEEPHLYSFLTGFEYLEMVGQLRGIEGRRLRDKVECLFRALDLWGDRDVRIAAYSKGMRQKALLSAALLHDPEIIILDEPFSGLDVQVCIALKRLIADLSKNGKTLICSSHVLEVIEQICSRVIILHNGRVKADDTVDHLCQWMQAPSLEGVFSLLALQQDPADIAHGVIEAMRI